MERNCMKVEEGSPVVRNKRKKKGSINHPLILWLWWFTFSYSKWEFSWNLVAYVGKRKRERENVKKAKVISFTLTVSVMNGSAAEGWNSFLTNHSIEIKPVNLVWFEQLLLLFLPFPDLFLSLYDLNDSFSPRGDREWEFWTQVSLSRPVDGIALNYFLERYDPSILSVSPIFSLFNEIKPQKTFSERKGKLKSEK